MHFARFSLVPVLLVSMVFVPSALAQAREEKPELVIRSTTQLVQVEVIVRNKEGNPVLGLPKESFEILEDGDPQTIAFFNSNAGKSSTSRAVGTLPGGVVSNRAVASSIRGGVTAILIDTLNTDWHSVARARRNLIRFLQTIHPDDRIAIYTLDQELKVVHDFTSNAESIVKRIRSAGMAPSADTTVTGGLDHELIPEMAAALKLVELRYRQDRDLFRIRRTFEALETIAKHLGSTPGWKSLIWISGGVPLSYGFDDTVRPDALRQHGLALGANRSFPAEFEAVKRAFSNANVAVFPINAEGLMTIPEFDAGIREFKSEISWPESNAVMKQLASFTGGQAYTDQNDVLGALRRSVDDSRASYTLGYYPSKSKLDGRYRSIQVRLSNSNLVANYRKGYYALNEAELKRADPTNEMSAAARDPLDSGQVGIDGQLLRSGRRWFVLLRVDGADVLWPDKSRFSVDASVGIFQYDVDGKALGGFVDNIHFKLDPARAAQLASEGMMYRREVNLNPKVIRLRAVVRSSRNGSIGTLTLPTPQPTN